MKDDFQYEYNKKDFDMLSLKKFILEDYKNLDKEEIPLTSEKWKHFIKYIGKIFKRAYDVICVDGFKGAFVIGIVIIFILSCYLAQGYFSRKLNEYLALKKSKEQKKL